MASDSTEAILSDSQRENLQQGLDSGNVTHQTVSNRKRRLREKVKPAVYDLQVLSNHIPQPLLEHTDAFGEGYDSSDGPINRQRHKRVAGRVPDRVVDNQGNPVDPEYSPDAEHEIEKRFNELSEPNKASPETQEALIDAVAFLCRAAEAGELKVIEVLEKGFERYHQQRSERKPNEPEKIVRVKQRNRGAAYTSARNKERAGDTSRLTSIEKKALREASDSDSG